MTVHPAALLLLWGAAVAALQCLSPAATLAVTLFFAALAAGFGRALFFRLMTRSRWLFLTMGVLFLWFTPGVRLPSPWGDLGLTQEGWSFAWEHMARLVALLALLALLLTKLSHRGLVAGCYFLLPALGPVAEWRRAIAVRLMLTLEAVVGEDGKRRAGKGEWKALLTAAGDQESAGGAVHLQLPPWSWRDSLILGSTLAGGGIALWHMGWP
ncbi:hypothetical protein DLREEDagrD3_05120 [Denitratisoma sp. agr-D3]